MNMCSGVTTENLYSSQISLSDTVGDLAIARFHCDRPACRVAIVQLLQTGQLTLPR